MLNLWKEALVGVLLIESFGSAIALPPRRLMPKSDELSIQGHHIKQRDNLSPHAGLFIRDDDDDDPPRPPNGLPRPDNNPPPPRPPQRDGDDDDDDPHPQQTPPPPPNPPNPPNPPPNPSNPPPNPNPPPPPPAVTNMDDDEDGT
ncbi:hypothetical protein CSAL01_04057 [Colletotrichum salicis]|uniref:Uncharacterized protein n=1 Tax=Colletotrichum salicis TaxID=1209931 RepID=A0A135V8D1_9PEZI|nr:hypothetical protein CSAL01_04057 [Colletotrichum salicis]